LAVTLRSFICVVFAAVISLAGSVRSQTTLRSEPAEARQITPTQTTSHPQVIDHFTELNTRRVAVPNQIPTPQSVIPVYKTSGKEFYLIFLSTVGTQSSGDPSLRRIYISSRSRVRGKISLARGGFEQAFQTDAKGLIAIDLPDWAEMTTFETEVILPKVFKIEAEDEIAVYGFSHKFLSR
jgi:hypothetical protein